MADANKEIILKVEVNIADAVKKIEQAKKEIESLSFEQKKLNISTEEGTTLFAKYSSEIDFWNTTLKESQNVVEQYLSSYIELYNNLEKSITEYTRLADQINILSESQTSLENEDLYNFFTKMLETFSQYKQSSDQLNTIMQGFTESIQSLKKEISSLVKVINTIAKANKNQSQEIEGLINNFSNYFKEIENVNTSTKENIESTEEIAKKSKTLKEEIEGVVNQMALMRIQGEQNTEEYAKLTLEAAQYSKALQDATKQVSIFSNKGASIETIITPLQAAKTAGEALANIIGKDSEAGKVLSETLLTLQTVIQTLTSVQAIYNVLQSKDLAIRIKNVAFKIKDVFLTQASTAAIHGQTAVTAKATIAQRLLNLVMRANPVLLIVTGILALIAVFSKLSSASKKAAEQQKRRNALDNLELENKAKICDAIREESQEKEEAIQHEIKMLQAKGASISQITTKEKELQNQQAATREKIKEKYKEEIKNLEENKKKSEELTQTLNELNEAKANGSKKLTIKIEGKFQKINVEEYIDIIQNKLDTSNKKVEIAVGIKKADLVTNRENELAKENEINESRKRYKQQQKIEADRATEELEFKQQIENEKLKITKINENARLKVTNVTTIEILESQHKLAKQEIQNQLNYEKDKLDIQLKFKQISQKEYNKLITRHKEIESLKLENLESENNSNKHDLYIEQIKEINELIKESGKLQKEQIEEKYNTLNKAIDQNTSISDDDKIYYKKELAKREQKELNEINKQIIEEDINNLKKEYEDKLIEASNHAKKQLDIAIQLQKDIIKKKKESGEGIDINTTEEELALKKLEMQKSELELDEKLLDKQIELNENILNEAEFDKQVFELKQKHLEEKLKLYNQESIEHKRIKAEMLKNEEDFEKTQKETLLKQIDNIANKAHKIKEAFSSAFDCIKDIENLKLQQSEENAEKEKELLKEQLDNGVINQQEYAEKVSDIDKDLDQKKAEIARKQAIREKAIRIFDTLINTAAAIAKIWVTPGFPLAIPLAAFIGAQGALQVATIAATPLPKAAKGGKIIGLSHSQGGVMIEAEGGEYIINKKNAAIYGNLLSMLNDNNLQRYNTPFGDGGYAYRTIKQQQNENINPESISAAVASGIQKANIYVAVEDIEKMQNKSNR